MRTHGAPTVPEPTSQGTISASQVSSSFLPVRVASLQVGEARLVTRSVDTYAEGWRRIVIDTVPPGRAARKI